MEGHPGLSFRVKGMPSGGDRTGLPETQMRFVLGASSPLRPVAQQAERILYTDEVVGSSPSGSIEMRKQV